LPISVPGSEFSRNFAPLWVVLLFTVGLAFPERVSEAQTKYPNKAVRIVLPFAAGGVADITARIVAEKLGLKLGGRFYVENQPGAGGIAAARTVTGSPRDGHTLALLSNGTAVSASLFKDLPYDPVKDFEPISSLGFFDFVFATNRDSEFKTLPDFVAAAKAKPGALNVGTINVGSTQNLSAELFKTAAGIDFTIIPYRASPELLVATLQGNLALMIDSYSSIKGNLLDKNIRALASSGPVRSESTPDIPTLQESGVANYDVVSWNALFAPAGTPPEIIKILNQALAEILAESEVKNRLLELGVEARASTPGETSARLKSDIEKWRIVIEKAGVPRQ
jgi:tripartite-type tricarboxylate transporter receptor subunit TctC